MYKSMFHYPISHVIAWICFTSHLLLKISLHLPLYYPEDLVKKKTQTMSFYSERFYFIHFASFLKLCNFYLTHFPSCRRERRYKSKQPLAVVLKNAGKRYHIEKYAKFTDMQRLHFSKLIIDLTFRWKSKFIIHNVLQFPFSTMVTKILPYLYIHHNIYILIN